MNVRSIFDGVHPRPLTPFITGPHHSQSHTSGSDGVRLWDTTTGRRLPQSHLPESGHAVLVFTPDGNHLIGDGDGCRLLDARTGRVRCSWTHGDRTPQAIAVAADGKTAAVSWRGGGVTAHKLSRGGPRDDWKLSDDEPAELSLSGDGAVLAGLMKPGIDAADLYFQNSVSESWFFEDGIVKSGSSHTEQGVGVRAMSGEKTGFAYSDELSLPALIDASGAATAIVRQGQVGSLGMLRAHIGAATTVIARRPLPYGELGHDALLFDARATLRLGPLETGIDVYNLLDARWYDGEFVYASAFGDAASLVPERHVTVGAPRSFLWTLTLFV